MDSALAGLDDVLIGSLLGALGLAAIVLSLVRRRGADPLLASFGFFAALYGIRLIFNNPMTPALGVSRATSAWINNLVTYIILVPAWFFFWKLLGDGWRSLNRWWVKVVTVFAVVAVLSDVVQGTPGTLGALNNVIVLLGLVVIACEFWRCRRRMTTDLRILMVGLSIFGLFAINENLVPLGLLPWSWRGEAGGFLIFVGCLGWIAARRFVATERDLATVEGELEAANIIQSSILPADTPQMDGLAVASRFRPSSAVAGDLFDFLVLTPQQLGILIADVSGHGVPAALIASMVKVAFESRADCAARPAELLTKMNRTLCGSFQHGFVSAAYVLLDLASREAIVACGGHPYPLLKRGSTQQVLEVGGSGAILGRFPDAEFEQQRLALEPGDRLILYTDGIVETRNAANEMFGEDRLRSLLAASASISAERFCDVLMDDLEKWSKKRPRTSDDDDLTLVVADIQPGEPSEG